MTMRKFMTIINEGYGDANLVEDAQTLVGYHGSPAANIKQFSLKKSPGGIYFYPDKGDAGAWKGGTVYKAEITLQNPLVTTDRRTVQHSDANRREWAMNYGHDGMIWIDDAGKPIEIVAFKPESIKIIGKQTRERGKPWQWSGVFTERELR